MCDRSIRFGGTRDELGYTPWQSSKVRAKVFRFTLPCLLTPSVTQSKEYEICLPESKMNLENAYTSIWKISAKK